MNFLSPVPGSSCEGGSALATTKGQEVPTLSPRPVRSSGGRVDRGGAVQDEISIGMDICNIGIYEMPTTIFHQAFGIVVLSCCLYLSQSESPSWRC